MLKSKRSRRRGKGAISTVDFIKRNLDFAHRALTDAANGTDAQLHFVPADGSHSIAWCLWHTARVEDLIVNARIGGGAPIWNDEWAQRTGLPGEGFGAGMSDDGAQTIHINDMRAFVEYRDAVWASSAKFLDGATDEELAREVPSRNGSETVAESIGLHVLGHFNGHRGEINTLRGMQGMLTVLAVEGTH